MKRYFMKCPDGTFKADLQTIMDCDEVCVVQYKTLYFGGFDIFESIPGMNDKVTTMWTKGFVDWVQIDFYP